MTAPTAGSGSTHPPGHPGTGGPPPPPPPKDSLPSLIVLASLVRSVLDGAIHMLGGQYDPRTGPSQQDDPWGPEAVDIHFGSAVADCHSAMREIDAVVALLQPAATYPGPSDSRSSLSGGSASHPGSTPGEGLSPGLDTGLRRPDNQSERPVVGPFAGSSHLAASSVAASGGLLPGLAVPPGESEATRLGRVAGESSDPRPRIGGDAPEMTGVPTSPDEHHDAPGVGQPHTTAGAEHCRCSMCTFTLPVTERFTMPGTERIARSINEALTGRSW